MADSGTSGIVIFFLIFIFIWLAIVTALLVAAWLGKVNIAPTGPTGAPNGIVGPTGPTGYSSATSGLSMIQSNIQSNLVNTSIGTTNSVANCDRCQFYTNGNINNTQIIPSVNPQIVRWVLNNNTITLDYNNGVFILPVGTYSLSGSINYIASMNGGTYRSMAVWLHSNTTNNVNENELIGVTSALSISNLDTVLTFPFNLQFNVTSNRNIFSVITWHDAPVELMIGGLGMTSSRFNLIKIS
jgi:uncharacterized protein YejL (UPF0352 family)